MKPLAFPSEFVTDSFGISPAEDESLDLAGVSAWDMAVRYHEFKGIRALQPSLRQIRRRAAQAILERAKEVLGSIVHPDEIGISTWRELPADAEQAEIELDETLENSLVQILDQQVSADDLWMSYRRHRTQSVVLAVDTSLSMTGEKLALTAVALAVVLLQFPEDPIGVVAFESEARVLKRPDERMVASELIERFLDVPAQGYTHLEEGLRSALKVSRSVEARALGRPPATVLLSDGKYTAGRDPSYLAPRFFQLMVLKMGEDRSSLGLCRDLARKGRGSLSEVASLESLPGAMYGVVKDLLRGRSLA